MMKWDDTRGELTNRTKHAGMSLASGSPARDVSESLESGLISLELSRLQDAIICTVQR